jgi:uncharacterized iron-regulated protein
VARNLPLWLLWVLLACAPQAAGPIAPTSARPQPVVTPLVLVHETQSMQSVDFEDMLDALASRQVVLVGETHLDDNTHRLETAMLEGLARRKPGKVVLALEMFQRDVQPVLDAYLQGEIDEATFRARARPWPNYDTGYRPLIELARAQGIPVVAANLPADLQRDFAMKGEKAKSALTPEQRAVFPREVIAPHDAYWVRLGQTLRDHFHGHDPSASPRERAYSVQNLWDNSMAEATVDALQADPERTVVLIAGAFHVEYGHGLAHQIRARKPDADLSLVTIVATHDLQAVDPRSDRERADVLLYTPARARGTQNGVLASYFPSELEFRIDVPEVPDAKPMPLLVWLGDAGDSVLDDQRYWKAALGDEAIVVTVQPPHPLQTDDLRMAGRWFWSHRTERDLAHLSIGLARMLELVEDRFAIDSDRVVVAGRGQGATVAVWAALGGGMAGSLVAWAPRDAASVTMRALPDPPAVRRRATLVGAEEALAQTLIAGGIDVHAEPLPEQTGRHALEDRLRGHLGLPAKSWGTPRETLLLLVDSAVGRQWAHLHARIAERDGEAIRVAVAAAEPGATVLQAVPDDFADGQALPLAPGPFGGTTIVVLPPTAPKAERAAWQELADNDVIKQRSRFASVHVCTDEELPALLETLQERGKRSILIVPAAFAATAQRMQALRALVATHEADLDLHWLPGLGGELARVRMNPDPSQ